MINSPAHSFANSFNESYTIKLGYLDIGKLAWKVDVSHDKYKISVKLEDRGFLSGLYRFGGDYEVGGYIKNGLFIPSKYTQQWSTKKKKRSVEIIFSDGALSELLLLPKEKELPRIEYIGVIGYADPLTSFLNILMGKEKSKTIDGRRIYSMILTNKDSKKIKKILIDEYVNIWADHKKNDLEYIEFIQKDNGKLFTMPTTLKIRHNGFSFNLEKN